MNPYKNIILDIADGVATLTLNRPHRLNALTPETIDEVSAALTAAVSGSARALVLTGAGRAFCSGADLADEAGNVGVPDDLGMIVDTHYNPLARQLAELPIPTISAVRGAAAGAGCSFALHADFVVASRTAYFLLAFVNIGLVPDAGATWLVARSVGRARALEMALLGERLPAEAAHAVGLIYKVVDDEALASEAQTLAARLARAPTMALSAIRRLIADASSSDLGAALTAERVTQTRVGFSHDAREGIAAFVEKRRPDFTGK